MTRAETEDEGKTDASLARLRLFLASHAPNGSREQLASGSSTSPRKAQASTASTTDCSETHATSDQLEGTHDDEHKDGNSDPNAVAHELLDETEQTTIPAAGAVASVSPMSQSSKEFARVKYLLQCSLPGRRVHDDVVLWDMRNPALVAQYAQHTAGLLELESWVAVNDLGADMGDVHSYGFTALDASQTGMKFTTGNLQLPDAVLDASDTSKAGNTRQLVLCKIAVGRSLVIRDETEAKARLPPGYHSFYLHRGSPHSPEDDQEQHEAEMAALLDRGYYHEYILTNTLQILPQYLVRFSFSAADAQGSDAGLCALCEQHAAVVLCRACEAQTCAHCDQEVHSANKLVRRHKRTPLRSKARVLASTGVGRGRRRSSSMTSLVPSADAETPDSTSAATAMSLELPEAELNSRVAKHLEEGLLADETRTPTCSSHRGKKLEFYCPVCLVPVCVSCKMVGDHSIGEKGAHRLLTVADAYESCLRESLRPDPLISSRKAVIESKLQSLARAQRSVLANKTQVACAIREQCERALRALDDAVAVKMRVLGGEELEFERQLQQIDWVDESLEDHRALYPALEFLAAWSQHKLLRAEQRDFPAFAHGPNNGAEQVKADLQLTGELQVLSAEQLAVPRRRTSLTPSNDGEGDNGVLESGRSGNQGGVGADGSPAELRATALLAQRRRPSDSEIRKRLLNMKATLGPACSATGAGGAAGFVAATRTFVSPKCQQLLDEIRHDLLVQSSSRKEREDSSGSVCVTADPADAQQTRFGGVPLVGMAGSAADVSSRFRAFSLQQVCKPKSSSPDGDGEKRAPSGQRQRRGTSAWSTLLRHEMGLAS